MTPNLHSRYHGAILGLAVGDALGTTLEFQSPGTFEPITDMVGGGPFELMPGEWTDDTSMALCLAESLLRRRGFDPIDQMKRYLRWRKFGHLSSNGKCFDIGMTVRNALNLFKKMGHQDPWCGATDPMSAGNGSLMRLVPIPLYFRLNTEKLIEYAGDSSRTTHNTRPAIDACRVFAAMILRALDDHSKDAILDFPGWRSSISSFGELCSEIESVVNGSFRTKPSQEIQGTGYVVQSLEAALWAFAQCDSFEQGALLAVNLGDDADTTGAIYGQLAGAYFGAEAIPEHWLAKLARRADLEYFAERLFREHFWE